MPQPFIDLTSLSRSGSMKGPEIQAIPAINPGSTDLAEPFKVLLDIAKLHDAAENNIAIFITDGPPIISYVCCDCGPKVCNHDYTGRVTWHNGTCDACQRKMSITEVDSFGGLRKENDD